ncbi:hypothetical protein C8J56DRAFT_363325 [Mycena floridula]|nr:hypothetical protein C8J56DRAFT_363325 [Mycena floridula]
MTPEEAQVLKELAQNFQMNFGLMIPLVLFYGIYILLTLSAIYTLLRKRNKTRSTWILCALLGTIFIIITLYVCLFITICFLYMEGTFIANMNLPLMERFSLANERIVKPGLTIMWVAGVNGLLYIFGDGIVVWRAWAVWPGKRYVIILPASMLLAAFAIFLTSSTLRTMASFNPGVIAPQFNNLAIAAYTMSIATNFTSVVLIGIKAYQHRKFMKETLGLGNSAAGKVLLLLTESGAIFVVLQIINICLAFLDDDISGHNAFNIATHVSGVMMDLISAIYPTLIILIVSHHRSIARINELSNTISVVGQSPGAHTLSFARSPAVQTVETIESNTTGHQVQLELNEKGRDQDSEEQMV